jgi:spore coat polysaccharide biosynthesis protein SpsF (cytidylyltransferase family)
MRYQRVTRHSTVAIVQARMGSVRFPGKVLEPIGDRPMLRHVVERVEAVGGLDRIVVATSTEPEDRAIVDYCRQVLYDVDVTAVDDSADVLGRYLAVAEAARATTVVRVTADCPLLDPGIARQVLKSYALGCEYCSNVFPRTYPDGLDVEVFSIAALRRLHRQARSPLEREHVTLALHLRPWAFGVIRGVRHDEDLSALRWTVDTPEDLAFVREVYARMAPRTVFSWTDVLALGEFAQRRAAA